ncbi:MAG: cell surface protein SprA, partial [Bacteroidota bacterium]
FQLASKSLVGARGDFNLGKNSTLGFTYMNLNQQSLSDKVRLGEEPISNSIMGIDGGTTVDMDFLTRAMNWIPGIRTTAASQFTLRGEAAYMLPDPNTRKSPIPQDHGSGMAYIDDFEGALRQIPLGIGYTIWRESSPPYYVTGLDPPYSLGLDRKIPTDLLASQVLADTSKMWYKAKMTWFNVIPTDVITSTIWGNRKSVAKGQDQVTVLNLYFKPQLRGAFNYSMNLDSTLFADPRKAWGGIQHLIGTTSTNLLDENISFIELWVKIVRSPASAKLNINLGYISEDVVPTPSNVLNTEDGVHGGIRTGYLKPGEDVGLDGLTDDEERSRYATFLEKYATSHPEYASDPSGDDWTRPPFSSRQSIEIDPTAADQYLNSNGTEGNSGSELGARFPDTEDLNGNNALDRANAYFEYELPLDTTNAGFQKYVTGYGQSGWYQVRIPLNDFARQIGAPTFTNVESVRLWLTGAQSDVLLRMTEFNLIGNQWEELVKNDPQFKVSVVNVEDNPDYQSPVEGLRTRDPAHPDQAVYSNEQSLNLVISELTDGQIKETIKRFVVKPLDLFNYRSLKMFVHGEEGDVAKGYQRFQFIDTTTYTVEMFLRFGSDSLNYYEYRLPVRTGWDQANDITINFAELTAIKFLRDSGSVFTHRVPVPNAAPGVTYQIRGDPTLTNVRYVSIGVQNPNGKTVPGSTDVVNGELWVDELRLTDVDNTPGLAYRFDSSIKLADVANLTFSYTDRDPNFHSLEERFGTRSTTRNWGLTANIGFERFLPESWTGSSLSFSYSHIEATAQPRYVPGTDILVEAAAQRVQEDTTQVNPTKAAEAVRTKSQDLSVTETYALPNIKLNIPSTSWLVTETINRLSLGYSYNITTRRSPTIEFSEAWGWNARANYGLQFGANYLEPLSLFGDFFLFSPWKNARIYFTPRQIGLTASMARSQSKDRARNQVTQNPTVRNLSASRAMNFNWQLTENGLLNVGTDYTLDIQSSLVHLELDRFGNQRSFSDILGDMFLNDRLVNFGNDLSYSQSIGFTSKPVVPPLLKLDKILTPSFRYNVGYNWSNNLQAGELGKSAQWNASFNATTDINIRAISEQIWSSTPARGGETETPDTVAKSVSLTDQIDRITRVLLKNTLFDFEKLGLTFSQTTRAQNTGVVGRPGFGNLFNRIPFFQSSTTDNGPSLYYQLGLSPDPNGEVILKAKKSFPFFTGYSVPGLRARNGSLTDVYTQTNRITMRTSRSLWEGAQLELNWNVGWSYNENKTIVTDSTGVPFERNRVVTGDLDRSFISFPPVLIFKLFRTSIEDVNKKYEALKINHADPRADDAKLSQAFVEGLEAFPVITKILGNIAPRANWTIRWDGLEKFSIFKSFAQRVSFDHSYSSSYRRRWRISQDGAEVTESQTVTYGFSPLIGVSFTFKELFKGNFGATVRYNTTTSFDLNPSVQNVSEGGTSDISLSANYSRQGFEIPFFGLSLSNDLDVSFSYTYSLNARKIYDMKDFRPEGTPQEGSTRTVMEPRIRYILSARVTASLYYRYTKIAPYQGVSKVPGSTINEGGLDVHVAIQ